MRYVLYLFVSQYKSLSLFQRNSYKFSYSRRINIHQIAIDFSFIPKEFLNNISDIFIFILHHIPRNIKEKQSVFCTTQFMILKTIYSVCVGVKQAYTITNLCILDDWWSQLLQIYYIILSKDLKEQTEEKSCFLFDKNKVCNYF